MKDNSTKKFYLAVSLIILGTFFLLPNHTFAQTKIFENLVYMTNDQKGIKSFKNNAKYIDIIAPQSYTLNYDLDVVGSVPDEIKNIAKDNKVKVMPLIVNANFNQALIHKLLISSTTIQKRIIDYLVTEAIKNNYVGWQFDFEHIYYTDRDSYSTFIETTSKAFKDNGLSLSIAAVSRSNDIVTDHYKNWEGAFDYERISKSVDFISIMTYDDPNSNGPVASMPFVVGVYEYLKDKIPPQKLSLGVPFYYWGWSVSPSIKVRPNGTYERLAWLRQTYHVVEGFSDVYKIPFLKYSIGKKQYVVWHEDAKSLAFKLNLVKENNLRGISAWKLGMENPSVWTALYDIIKK